MTSTAHAAPPLPELADALVPAETVRALFDDLTRLAQIEQIIARPRAQQRAQLNDAPLEVMAERLLSGELSGLQVIYRWDGHAWRDAILATAAGFRIVRIQIS